MFGKVVAHISARVYTCDICKRGEIDEGREEWYLALIEFSNRTTLRICKSCYNEKFEEVTVH